MTSPVVGRGGGYPRGDTSAFGAAVVLGFASLLAVMLGLFALTTSPILIALATAAIVAPVLGFRPKYALWLLLVGGLLVAGVVPIWSDGQAGRAVWALSALSFFLLAVLLGQAAVSPSVRRDTPAFIWLMLTFAAYACVVSLLRWQDAYQAFSGFKRYFQGLGVMAAFAVRLSLSDRDMARVRRFVLFVAVLQLPWAIYELLRLVPLREASTGCCTRA